MSDAHRGSTPSRSWCPPRRSGTICPTCRPTRWRCTGSPDRRRLGSARACPRAVEHLRIAGHGPTAARLAAGAEPRRRPPCARRRARGARDGVCVAVSVCVNKIVRRVPKMRLRIAPGSLWLAYSLTDPRAVERLLPAPSLSSARRPRGRRRSRSEPQTIFQRVPRRRRSRHARHARRDPHARAAPGHGPGEAGHPRLPDRHAPVGPRPRSATRQRALLPPLRGPGDAAYASGLSNGRDQLVLRALRGERGRWIRGLRSRRITNVTFKTSTYRIHMTLTDQRARARARAPPVRPHQHPLARRALGPTLPRFHHEQAMFFNVDVASFGRA